MCKNALSYRASKVEIHHDDYTITHFLMIIFHRWSFSSLRLQFTIVLYSSIRDRPEAKMFYLALSCMCEWKHWCTAAAAATTDRDTHTHTQNGK